MARLSAALLQRQTQARTQQLAGHLHELNPNVMEFADTLGAYFQPTSGDNVLTEALTLAVLQKIRQRQSQRSLFLTAIEPSPFWPWP